MAFDPSHLDTSFGALIRSGAAILGIVLGGFIVSASPRKARNVFLGLFFVVDGLGYGFYALGGGFSGFPHKGLVVPTLAISTTCSVLVCALLLGYGWPELRRLRERKASGLVAALVFVGVAGLTPFLIFLADGHQDIDVYGSPSGVRAAEFDAAAFSVYMGIFAALAIALAERLRLNPDDPRNRASLLLAGMMVTNAATSTISVNVAFAATSGIEDNFGMPTLARGAFLVSSAAFLPAVLWLLRAGRLADWPRWAPVAVTLVALAMATIELILLVARDFRDGGFGGIVSILTLAAVAFAVFRFDLLGAEVRRPRAGVLATVGLGALFITAQVLQNFFSDRLGFLIGGVVAGAVVFVAYPLQRAAERAAGPGAAGTSAVAKYRRLVETAWTDGKLGANERLLLAESRRQLGLDAETALGIDDEVARKHAEGRGRSKA